MYLHWVMVLADMRFLLVKYLLPGGTTSRFLKFVDVQRYGKSVC
jgi:hypothetical protein